MIHHNNTPHALLSRVLSTLALAVVAMLIFAGCDAVFSAQEDEPSATRYDGETLFRGIFLAQGEIPTLFPEVWDMEAEARLLSRLTEEEQQEYFQFLEKAHRIQNEAISNIKETHPDFFPRFASAMQSGEHLQVREALTEGATLFVESMAFALDMSVEEYEELIAQVADGSSAAVSAGKGTCLVAAVVLVAAVAVVTAAAVNHVFAINVAAHRHVAIDKVVTITRDDPLPAKHSSDSEQLHADMLINLLATRLAI